MIELYPIIAFSTRCKTCESDSVTIKAVLFQGIHLLADCHCEHCHADFYHTLPSGHDLHFPIQFLKDGSHSFFDPKADIWLAKPLIRSIIYSPKHKTNFTCQICVECSTVVLLNCIDCCFGHVFTKLWNASTLMKNHPELGVVVIIPVQCAWLVPQGVAEIWSVHSPLKDCSLWLEGFDQFAHAQFTRFKKVFLSHAFTHIDSNRYINLDAFLKKQRFDLSVFGHKPVCITFVLREDRFWHNNITLDFLYRVMKKGKLQRLLTIFFIARQNYLVKKTAKLIRSHFPEAKIIATGLGKTGTLDNFIIDLRANRILPETEVEWKNVFSESQIVIGVHGSNMLIPSSLAAGFINLMPRYKIAHLTEDICQPYSNRYLQFLGRFLDEYSSPQLVALHAISIIRDFPYIYKNTEQKPE